MSRAVGGAMLAAAILLGGESARAKPPELRGLVDASSPAGCHDYSYLFWDLYRARLWTDAGRPPGDHFALSLTYRSAFSREDLVESSIEEMARISGKPEAAFAAAREQMERAFRSVEPGDRITVWRESTGKLPVFVNGMRTGALTHHVDLFLSIWLGPGTRHPEGREKLIGEGCDG